jgi:hypothetical protein
LPAHGLVVSIGNPEEQPSQWRDESVTSPLGSVEKCYSVIP